MGASLGISISWDNKCFLWVRWQCLPWCRHRVSSLPGKGEGFGFYAVRVVAFRLFPRVVWRRLLAEGGH